MKRFVIIIAALLQLGAGRLVIKDNAIDNANLADSPELTIQLESTRVTNQLSLVMNIVKGTSTQFRLTCRYSADGTNFGKKTTCTAIPLSVCAAQSFNFDDDLVAGETGWTFDVPTNYRTVKCVFDDPLDGTGTITVDTVRGL